MIAASFGGTASGHVVVTFDLEAGRACHMVASRRATGPGYLGLGLRPCRLRDLTREERLRLRSVIRALLERRLGPRRHPLGLRPLDQELAS